jgi:hypothetical protein
VFSKFFIQGKKIGKYVPKFFNKGKKERLWGIKETWRWGKKFSCHFKRAQFKRLKDKQVINHKIINKCNAGCGVRIRVRIHAHLCAEDLKFSPLTSRANQLIKQ